MAMKVLGPTASAPEDMADLWEVNNKFFGYAPPFSGWYAAPNGYTSTTAVAVTSGRVAFIPIDLRAMTIDALVCQVGTAQVAGTTTSSLGIYPDNGTFSLPNTANGPLASASMTLTTTGQRFATLSTPLTITTNRHWLAFQYNATAAPTTVPTVFMPNNYALGMGHSTSMNTRTVGYYMASTTLPATALTAGVLTMGGTNTVPLIAVRAL